MESHIPDPEWTLHPFLAVASDLEVTEGKELVQCSVIRMKSTFFLLYLRFN